MLFICVLSDCSAPENVANLATPAKKLEHVIRLAELVIEVLQQNQDHHAEVSKAVFTVSYPANLSHYAVVSCFTRYGILFNFVKQYLTELTLIFQSLLPSVCICSFKTALF